MFRRLFWFVAGAVAGITGMSWLKRRATEMREAITPSSVLSLLGDLVVIAYRRALVGLSWLSGLVGPTDRTEVVAPPPPTVRTATRRHIASRPHNSHR
jgi:hypothetical protein